MDNNNVLINNGFHNHDINQDLPRFCRPILSSYRYRGELIFEDSDLFLPFVLCGHSLDEVPKVRFRSLFQAKYNLTLYKIRNLL